MNYRKNYYKFNQNIKNCKNVNKFDKSSCIIYELGLNRIGLWLFIRIRIIAAIIRRNKNRIKIVF